MTSVNRPIFEYLNLPEQRKGGRNSCIRAAKVQGKEKANKFLAMSKVQGQQGEDSS